METKTISQQEMRRRKYFQDTRANQLFREIWGENRERERIQNLIRGPRKSLPKYFRENEDDSWKVTGSRGGFVSRKSNRGDAAAEGRLMRRLRAAVIPPDWSVQKKRDKERIGMPLGVNGDGRWDSCKAWVSDREWNQRMKAISESGMPTCRDVRELGLWDASTYRCERSGLVVARGICCDNLRHFRMG